VRQGSVGSVGGVGRRSKVGGIIVPVSFWEVSVFRPNFKALKALIICTFLPTKILKTLYISAFRLDLSALLDKSQTLLMHNPVSL